MDPTASTVAYTVGQLAARAGVSVRTLHHYDRIGLLVPGARSQGGYRRYVGEDLDRLTRILAYRELDLPLERIGRLLDDPAADPAAHLRRQSGELRARITRLEHVLAAVTTTLEAYEMDIDLTPEERLELFSDFDPAEHETEARERWGETPAYAESRRRTATYTADDWRRLKAEGEAIEAELAEALAAGEPADGERAVAVAERHREHITRWFYDCPPSLHAALGAMYVDDPRFAAHHDGRAPGLARYVRDAIAANAAGR